VKRKGGLSTWLRRNGTGIDGGGEGRRAGATLGAANDRLARDGRQLPRQHVVVALVAVGLVVLAVHLGLLASSDSSASTRAMIGKGRTAPSPSSLDRLRLSICLFRHDFLAPPFSRVILSSSRVAKTSSPHSYSRDRVPFDTRQGSETPGGR